MAMSQGVGKHQTFRAVARLYGLKVRRFTSYHSLRRKNVAYRVETDHGTYLLKPFRRYYRRVARAYRWVRKLESAGFDHMPHWHIATNNQPIVRSKDTFYYINDWIDGEQLGTTAAEMEQLGRVLGSLHQTSRRIANGTKGRNYSAIYMNKQSRQNRLFRLRLPFLIKQKNRFGQWFRREGGRCLSLADKASKIIGRAEVQAVLYKERLQPAVIHGDVTRPNVIYSGDKIFLIDWDRARKGSVYCELVRALSNVAHFSVPHMQAFLHGYEQQHPFTPQQRQIVLALFHLPNEVWYAARDIVLKRPDTIFKIVATTWNDRLAAIQWLGRWASGTE